VVAVVLVMMADVVMVVVMVVRVSVLPSAGVCDIHRVGSAPIGPSVQRALTFSEHRPTSPQNVKQGGERGREGARRQQGRSAQGQGPRKFVFDHSSERPARPAQPSPAQHPPTTATAALLRPPTVTLITAAVVITVMTTMPTHTRMHMLPSESLPRRRPQHCLHRLSRQLPSTHPARVAPPVSTGIAASTPHAPPRPPPSPIGETVGAVDPSDRAQKAASAYKSATVTTHV
jgi:hypothetical protein